MNKTKSAYVKEKAATKKAPILEPEMLAEQYLYITRMEKELEAQKKVMRERVMELVENGSLLTALGTFVVVERQTYSWPLETVQKALPDTWTAFCQANNALLREYVKTGTAAAAVLSIAAESKVTEALTFKTSL